MQLSRPQILILTTHTGGGHINLAQSLKEMLGSKYQVDIADPYPNLMQQYYSTLSRYFMWFWDFQYTLMDNDVGAWLVHSVLTFFVKKRIAALLMQTQPQLIISTHPLLSYEIARVNQRLSRRIPLVFQLTDLEQTHTAWFTEKYADAYLAPTNEICVQAEQHGISAQRLHVTGRPVRRQFLQQELATKTELLPTLGLDPTRFTIFLQGGAKGSAGIERTVKNFLDADISTQIILAVGNNKVLAEHFANVARLSVLPFTPNIAPYMAVSDLIAGKAGASFLSEAFTLEKPCLITSYIPGQETPNLRFLQRHDLGWVCLDMQDQQELVNKITSNPTLLAEKVESIQTYKAWNIQANQAIYDIVDGLIVS